jgi:hypothetical protein
MVNQDIWYSNPIYYLTDKRFLNDFIPDNSMNTIRKLNASLRFSIYFAIIVFVIKRDARIFLLPIFVGGFTYALNSVENNKNVDKNKILENLNMNNNKNVDKYCVKPSKDNPFMNINYTDYTDFPNKPASCMAFEKGVEKEIIKKFNKEYNRPADDVFEKEGGYRQFYTTPSTTIPNDQDTFAKWLYTPKLRFKKNN